MNTFEAKINSLEAALSDIAHRFSPVALASSLSMEDQIITYAIARLRLNIQIFTLNTGRLHAETLAVIEHTQQRYAIAVEVFTPADQAVVHYVQTYGENAFYDSVELRKACCNIRKVEPLKRALATRKAWITGQRREQNLTRSDLAFEQEDTTHGLKKFNPLVDWLASDVHAYIQRYAVPVNVLHARGYPSIGCEPCTRAIKPGEDARAGRWWWENALTKECGLHIK